MNEVIVGIIAGLLSGVLGSVLGPVATHHLRRSERKEEREREIHKELREMIEERRADCVHEYSVALSIDVYVRHAAPPSEAYRRAMDERLATQSMQSRHRWEPYRITDKTLRSLAEQLDEGLHDLKTYHSSVCTMDINEWWAEVEKKDAKLRELGRQIRLQLDELCW